MRSIINFIVILIIIYFILSLPMILGYGVAIDFVRGVNISWFSKAKTYFITGIEYGYLTKLFISIVSAAALTTILKIKKK